MAREDWQDAPGLAFLKAAAMAVKAHRDGDGGGDGEPASLRAMALASDIKDAVAGLDAERADQVKRVKRAAERLWWEALLSHNDFRPAHGRLVEIIRSVAVKMHGDQPAGPAQVKAFPGAGS